MLSKMKKVNNDIKMVLKRVTFLTEIYVKLISVNNSIAVKKGF